MKNLYFENDFVEFWIENEILIQKFKLDVKLITYEMAIKIVEDRYKVSRAVWRPILVDLNMVRSAEKRARDYFAEEKNTKYLSIAAFLLNNYAIWMAGKLFLKFNKPPVKTELFKSRQMAMDWLQAFVNDETLIR